MLFGARIKPVHQPEKDLEVGLDLDPHNTLGAYVAADFLDHGAHQQLTLFLRDPFRASLQIQQGAGWPGIGSRLPSWRLWSKPPLVGISALRYCFGSASGQLTINGCSICVKVA